MNSSNHPITIAIVDDNAKDCMLFEEAFNELGIKSRPKFFTSGNQFVDYISHACSAQNKGERHRPNLILLNWNLQGLNGKEILNFLKSNSELSDIPTIVLTNSSGKMEINNTYSCGANSFIVKPSKFDELKVIIRDLIQYWTGTVHLPPR